MTRLRAWHRNAVIRFLVAGGTNTAATYGLYLALLAVMPYLAAYSIAYVTGIVLSYLLNTLYVFKQPLSFRRFAAFPLVYVVQYAIGSGVLWVAVQRFSANQQLAFIVSLCLTLPVTFLASRWLLTPNRSPAELPAPIDVDGKASRSTPTKRSERRTMLAR